MLDSSQLAAITASPYKKDFPLLANNPDLTFLDSAATSQRPRAVLDAQRRFYETMNANPLRGLYSLSVEATQAIKDARNHIASFIGAVDETGNPQGNEIVFTRNTSESLNLVARTLGASILKPGDEVVISIMEHHSNLIPWQQVCRQTGARLVYLRADDDFRITQDEIEEKIGPRAKIVSVTQVSNVLGVENPIRQIADRAHQMGAYMVVDGAQSVPHLKVDVHDLGADLLAFSAHKLGGPMGIGVLWGKADILNAMPPFLTGGEMIDSVTETDAVWAPVPQKFEAGTQDAAGSYAFDADLTYLESIGIDTMERREPGGARLCRRYRSPGGRAPRRCRRVQRARRAPARRREHPRRLQGVHPRRPPLRAAPARLARPEQHLPRERGVLQRQGGHRPPGRGPQDGLAGVQWQLAQVSRASTTRSSWTTSRTPTTSTLWTTPR